MWSYYCFSRTDTHTHTHTNTHLCSLGSQSHTHNLPTRCKTSMCDCVTHTHTHTQHTHRHKEHRLKQVSESLCGKELMPYLLNWERCIFNERRWPSEEGNQIMLSKWKMLMGRTWPWVVPEPLTFFPGFSFCTTALSDEMESVYFWSIMSLGAFCLECSNSICRSGS